MSLGSWTHFFPGAKAQVASAIHAQISSEIWDGPVEALNRSPPASPGIRARRAVQLLIERMEEEQRRTKLYFQLEAAL